MGCKTVFALIFAVAAVLLQPASAVSVSIHGPSNSSSSLYIGNGSISFFVNSNSSKVGINTTSPNATLSVVGGSAGFGGDSVYDIVVNGTNYRVHEFTTVGTSTFVPPAGVTSVEYLVVAGGGAGGTYWAGGGGAGGLVNGTMVISSAVTITVGDKGVRSTSNYINGGSGGNSSIGAVVAIGGGGGGSQFVDSANNGGSGGGCGNPRTAGGATQPGSASGGYGNNGGNASGYGGTSGGGGGAGGAGSNAVSASVGGAGGSGLSNSITGVATYYAGGGGGIGYTGGAGGVGGSGIGGAGGTDTDGARNGASATGFGSGGGGGAGNGGYGGYGSPGIVILRYPISGPAAIFQGSVILNGSASIGTSSSNAALQVAPTVLSVIGGSGGDGVFDIMDNGVAYRVHKFTTVGSSTFTPPVGVSSVEYLIVGGGGGGGTNNAGGGGGGGVLYGRKTMSAGSYPVVVGIGGANDTNGGNSYFGDLVAFGGGHGAYAGAADATSGASGGGGGGHSSNNIGAAGIAGQGYAGGGGVLTAAGRFAGGGGGFSGFGGTGVGGTVNGSCGNGGPGYASFITGNATYYAGGGGGGGTSAGTAGIATHGGGAGNAGLTGDTPGYSATANTGGGGGGGGGYGANRTGGAGGSGLVVLRYPLYAPSLRSDGISFFNGSVGFGTATPSAKIHVLSGPLATGGDSIYEIVQNGVAYRVHKFTSVGNSTFSVPAGLTSVEVLVVAGGGSGGALPPTSNYGGGGGAGGVYYQAGRPVSGAITVTVGAGGVAGNVQGRNGSDSAFGAIIAKGGGGGGSNSGSINGEAGGSGGGAGANSASTGAGGPHQHGTPDGATFYGNDGGSATTPNTGTAFGGGAGGGGAGSAGESIANTVDSGGDGGAGKEFSITGAPVVYAVGGGGGGHLIGGAGSADGGGRGAVGAIANATAGTNGTGNGGGGAENDPTSAASGGSGIVVVRYPISGPAAAFQGSVGLGTTNPQAALHVAGNTLFTGNVNVTGTIYTSSSCPAGMAYVPGDRPFCIDKYEASLASGTVYNSACSSGSQAEVDASSSTAVAGSAPGQIPITSINWCAAKKACQNAGKHLCRNAEWFQACNYKGSQWSITAEGTSEAMGCNTYSSVTNVTGASPGCVTQEGAYDLIGNVWEWVDRVVTADPTNGVASNYVTGYDFATGLPTSSGSTTSVYGNDFYYAYNGGGAARAFIRGGLWDNGDNAGCFTLQIAQAPSAVSPYISFRCCK